jgi:hypothetical protein
MWPAHLASFDGSPPGMELKHLHKWLRPCLKGCDESEGREVAKGDVLVCVRHLEALLQKLHLFVGRCLLQTNTRVG